MQNIVGLAIHNFGLAKPKTFIQVELSLTYGCEVSTAQILQYIHHNRNMNTMMIKTLAEKVAELAEENAKLAQQVQVIEKLNG